MYVRGMKKNLFLRITFCHSWTIQAVSRCRFFIHPSNLWMILLLYTYQWKFFRTCCFPGSDYRIPYQIHVLWISSLSLRTLVYLWHFLLVNIWAVHRGLHLTAFYLCLHSLRVVRHLSQAVWIPWWLVQYGEICVKFVLIKVNVLKFWTLFSFCSQIKCCLSGLEFIKCLAEWQTGKTLIRLLLQKQSDLGLHSLSRPFWLATSIEILEHLP